MPKNNNNNNNNNNSKRIRKSQRSSETMMNPEILKPLDTTIRCTKKFRFVCTALSVSKLDVKDTDLMFLLGVARSATLLSPIMGSVRMKEIEILKVNTNSSTTDYIAIEYKGDNPAFGNNSVIKSANSLSSFQYAHLKSKPPKDSYAAAWLYPSGYNLFQITCGQGAVVDLTIEFTLIDDTPPFSDPSVNAGLTAGTMYCHTLTGQNNPNIFVPQGWNASA